MQFLISVVDDPTTSPTKAELSATGAINDRLQSDGQLVFVGGLASPGDATVVDNRDGNPVRTGGPFSDSKEYVGGLYVIEAPDADAALAVATDLSQAANRKIEVRPFAD
jgi:hypothetical protein